MQRSKTALVLAGGGVAGAAYEIGAMCAIDQLLVQLSVNEFDIYVGTSAGAIVTSCLANNISPRTLLSVLDSPLLGIDQLEPQHLYALNLPSMLNRMSRLPGALGDIARRTFAERTPLSWIDLIETLAAALPGGLYDTVMLEEYMRAALTGPGRTNSFADLPHLLAIVATDLNTGDRAVFGQPPLRDVPISHAVCASAAIPLFYRPVRVGEHEYIDGGIRGTASLDVAIEAGAELIVCVNPMVPYDNRGHDRGHGIGDNGIPSIGGQVFRTFIHAGLHYHMKQVRRRHPEVDIILIEPNRDDHVMFSDNTMRYQTRMTIARHGYETVAHHLNDHYAYYRELMARHGIPIDNGRILQDLYNLRAAGNDVRYMRAALASDGSLHSAPAGLAHTLAELDRLVTRLEDARATEIRAAEKRKIRPIRSAKAAR